MSTSPAKQERGALTVMAIAAVALLLVGGWSLRPEPDLTNVVDEAFTPEILEPAGTDVEMPAVTVVPRPARCRGTVALTFDDGPRPLSLQLLNVLAERGVPATFFYTGREAELLPEVVRKAAAAGHQIANHTWDHPDLRTLSPAEVGEQLRRTNEVLTPLAGPVTYFRSPYGYSNKAIRAEGTRLGMVEALWTVDSKDYKAKSAEDVLQRSTAMADGDILLMHDGNTHSLRSLPGLINAYHSRGICFGRLAATTKPLTPWWAPQLAFPVRATPLEVCPGVRASPDC